MCIYGYGNYRCSCIWVWQYGSMYTNEMSVVIGMYVYVDMVIGMCVYMDVLIWMCIHTYEYGNMDLRIYRYSNMDVCMYISISVIRVERDYLWNCIYEEKLGETVFFIIACL